MKPGGCGCKTVFTNVSQSTSSYSFPRRQKASATYPRKYISKALVAIELGGVPAEMIPETRHRLLSHLRVLEAVPIEIEHSKLISVHNVA